MNTYTTLATLAAITLAPPMLMPATVAHDEPDATRYCKHVEDWRTDERRGLMPDQRRGWPDWRGVCGDDDDRCRGG